MPNTDSRDKDMQRALLVYRLGASFALAMDSLDKEVPCPDDLIPLYAMISFAELFIGRVKDILRLLIEPELEERQLMDDVWNSLDIDKFSQARREQFLVEVSDLIEKYGAIVFSYKSWVNNENNTLALNGANFIQVMLTLIECFEMLPSIHNYNQELIENAHKYVRVIYLNLSILERIIIPIFNFLINSSKTISQLLACGLTIYKDQDLTCKELVIDLAYLHAYRPINYGAFDECIDGLESDIVVVRILNVNYSEQHCAVLLNLVPIMARIKRIEKLVVTENHLQQLPFEPIARVWADICCLRNVTHIDNANFERFLRDPTYSQDFFQYRAWAAIKINAWQNIRREVLAPVPTCTTLTVHKAPAKCI